MAKKKGRQGVTKEEKLEKQKRAKEANRTSLMTMPEAVKVRVRPTLDKRRLRKPKSKPPVFERNIALPKGVEYQDRIKSWRGELARYLQIVGRKRKKAAMKRIAELFYDNDAAALAILKHMLPTLKAIDVKVDEAAPFQFIVKLRSPNEIEEESEE